MEKKGGGAIARGVRDSKRGRFNGRKDREIEEGR